MDWNNAWDSMIHDLFFFLGSENFVKWLCKYKIMDIYYKRRCHLTLDHRNESLSGTQPRNDWIDHGFTTIQSKDKIKEEKDSPRKDICNAICQYAQSQEFSFGCEEPIIPISSQSDRSDVWYC